MKVSISMRELQQHLKRVMQRVERGQVVEVTRRRRAVARLAPLDGIGPRSPWPDLDARARTVFWQSSRHALCIDRRHRGPRRPVTTYIDSSALVAAYVPERFSRAARRALRAAPQVPFTPLHVLKS
jgi:prevent-host-death family protein